MLPRVKNFHTTIAEEGDAIRFLREIVPGKATRSCGVQVAKMAGLPRPVVERATEILAQYEISNLERPLHGPRRMIHYEQATTSYALIAEPRAEYQVAPRSERSERAFEPSTDLPQVILDELLHLDMNAMTPMEALTKLYELKKRAEGR